MQKQKRFRLFQLGFICISLSETWLNNGQTISGLNCIRGKRLVGHQVVTRNLFSTIKWTKLILLNYIKSIKKPEVTIITSASQYQNSYLLITYDLFVIEQIIILLRTKMNLSPARQIFFCNINIIKTCPWLSY